MNYSWRTLGRTNVLLSGSLLLAPMLLRAAPGDKPLSKVWSISVARPQKDPPVQSSFYWPSTQEGGGKVAFIGGDVVALTIVRGCWTEKDSGRPRCFFETSLLDAATGTIQKRLEWDSNSDFVRVVAIRNRRFATEKSPFTHSPATEEPIDPSGLGTLESDARSKTWVGTWAMRGFLGDRPNLELRWTPSPRLAPSSRGVNFPRCTMDLQLWQQFECITPGGAIPSSGKDILLASTSVPGQRGRQWQLWSPAAGWTDYPQPKGVEPIAVLDEDLILLQSGKNRRVETAKGDLVGSFPGTGRVRAAVDSARTRFGFLEGVETTLTDCTPTRQNPSLNLPCLPSQRIVQTSFTVRLFESKGSRKLGALNLGVSDWELADIALSPGGSQLAVLFNGTLTLYQLPAAKP